MKSRGYSKYIGFDDRLFMTVGVFVLAMVTTILFNSKFYSGVDLLLSFLISILFTLANWSLLRAIMILLRKKFPHISDSLKRNVLFLFCIVGVVLIVNLIGDFLLKLAFGPSYGSNDGTGNLVIVLISIMTMSIYEAIYYFNKLRTSIVKEEQTRQVITESRLDALRNQARPHFLFNSLNTLRDIIDSEPREEAKVFVDRLADVYRFILDTGQANVVTVAEEIAFAKSYLYIQSERFGENLRVDWHLPQELEKQSIIPMSLQLLVENAIKHNVISKSKPLRIAIEVSKDYMTVTNDLQLKSTQLPSTKLGLANIRKRYELIGDRLPLVKQTDNTFAVSIPIGI